jgi:hypothetical protein
LFIVTLGATTVARASDEHRVTLCHATDSTTNPYVSITVDYHAVINGGHGNHEGPVFSADLPDHTKWGDIIPPFDLGGDAQFAGMNWPDGQAILDNGCAISVTTTTVHE